MSATFPQLFELGERRANDRTLKALRATLEKAGVEFTDGDEPGVKLRKAKKR